MKKSLLYNWWLSGGAPDVLAENMDLINLQSTDAGKFTIIPTNKISAWAEEGGTLWSQSTDANRPLLTGLVPTFDASNDTIIRASEVGGTVLSLYFVFKNTSTLTKILAGAGVNNDYILHASNFQMQLATSAVSRCGMESGIAVNKRYVIFSVRRNGNTVVGGVDDRRLFNRSNTFAGQSTLIQKLATNPAGNFPMGGGIRAVCMSSSYLDDSTHQHVVNALYTKYNLSADTAAMTVMGFGDSNTFGTGSTSYLVGLSSLMSLSYTQLGISGTRFTNTSGQTNNGYDRFNLQLITRPYTDYIVIQYGTNDVLGAVSAATFETQLAERIAGLIAAGHPPSRICLLSTPYQRDDANETVLNDYRTAINTIATNNGTKYWDLLQWMRDNGANALMGDAVHYNQTTQDAIRDNVFTQFTT